MPRTEFLYTLQTGITVCRDGLTLSTIAVGSIAAGDSNLVGGYLSPDGNRIIVAVRATGLLNTLRLRESLDGGVTWAAPYPDVPGSLDVIDLIRLPNGTLLVFVNTNNPLQCYRLPLSASSWTGFTLPAPAGASGHQFKLNPRTGHVSLNTDDPSGGAAHVFISSDNGVTWTDSGGIGNFNGPFAYEQSDGIANFTNQSQQLAGRNIVGKGLTSDEAFTTFSVVINVNEKSEDSNFRSNSHFCILPNGGILFATFSNIRRSLDQGQTWAIVASGLGNSQGMSPRATSRGRVFAGLGGLMMQSDDNGVTWVNSGAAAPTSQQNPMIYNSADPLDEDTLGHLRSGSPTGGIPGGVRLPRGLPTGPVITFEEPG